jgi:hypothetical protein
VHHGSAEQDVAVLKHCSATQPRAKRQRATRPRPTARPKGPAYPALRIRKETGSPSTVFSRPLWSAERLRRAGL